MKKIIMKNKVKIKIYNLFKDYPYNLTSEEKEIFDKENPYWADFFKDRN